MTRAKSSSCGGDTLPIMKSCHTMTPCASQKSKNASGSYTPPPHTRIMLQLRSSIIARHLGRCCASREWSASIGLQSVPFTNVGSPLIRKRNVPGFSGEYQSARSSLTVRRPILRSSRASTRPSSSSSSAVAS